MFGDVQLPTRNKPSFAERNTSDKPVSVRVATLPSRLVWRFRQRIRSLQALDEANAATIRALRRAGELDNTLIAYVSDNGYQLGEHNLYTKNQPYAESLQIVPDARMFRGVRTSRYTWVVWWDGFEELYDHARDPYELDNLTGRRGRVREPAYQVVRDELRRRYLRLRSCAGYQDCERRAFGPEPLPLPR